MTKIDMRDAFFEKLVEAARLDERIIVLSADHGAFALKKFEEEMPDRYINIGIAEQNMVGVAAGLAASGKIVFIYGISPFVSLRVLEQLTIDVAAMQLPVNVISVGAGFTYSTDGPTHQGLQDVAAIATIPGMTILNSSDPANARAFVDIALATEKPHYIRVEKEKLSELPIIGNLQADLIDGVSLRVKGDDQVLIITTGQISHSVLEATTILKESHGISVSFVDVLRLKSFPEESLLGILGDNRLCISISELYEPFFEERIGGIISKAGINTKFVNFGVPEIFHFTGDERSAVLRSLDFDSASLAALILMAINESE